MLQQTLQVSLQVSQHWFSRIQEITVAQLSAQERPRAANNIMASRGRDVPAPPRPDPALRRDTAEPLKRDRSGERALAEAFESGREILTRLNEQGESLQRSEVVADSNQYVLDRSARTLSNMTWSGWIANTFRPAPKPPPPPPARRAPKKKMNMSAFAAAMLEDDAPF